MNIENKPKIMSDTLKCPISFEIMTDPVITPNGDTYQREFIERWIREKGNCPITRNPITLNQLIPNKALKQYIETTIPSIKIKSKPIIKNILNKIFNTNNLQNIIVPIENVLDEPNVPTESVPDDSVPTESVPDESVPNENIPIELIMPQIFDFRNINCTHEKRCFVLAYNTITRLNKWTELRNFIVDESRGFQFGKNENILFIMNEIERDYKGHSGSSIGITMRHMHFISKHGVQEYENKFI